MLTFEKVNREIKVYTESDLLSSGTEYVQELYRLTKETVVNWGPNIKVNTTKLYVTFKVKTNFCDIEIGRNQLKI